MSTLRSLHIVVLLISLFGYEHVHAETNLCKENGKSIVFTKETRIIPYKRVYLDSAWSLDEENSEKMHRFPIMGMMFSTGKFDPEGLYVSGYQSDYFPVKLMSTKDRAVFMLEGLMWPAPPLVYDERNKFLEKYSGKDISYYLSFTKNEQCDEGLDLSVLVYRNKDQVETIFFHIKDMSNAKDFWPEERSRGPAH